jgi:hypothetical protein
MPEGRSISPSARSPWPRPGAAEQPLLSDRETDCYVRPAGRVPPARAAATRRPLWTFPLPDVAGDVGSRPRSHLPDILAMLQKTLFRAVVLVSAVVVPGCAHLGTADTGRALRPFSEPAELEAYEKLLRGEWKSGGVLEPIPPPPPPAPAPAPTATGAAPTFAAGESITNVQHAGADEGGIVKVHGDHLVVLRRGRLFTIRVGDDALQPVAESDAFGPDIDPSGSWFDEILVSDGLVAVIGYSYRRGGTEVGLFRIDDAGGLTHLATYQLRSSDYYSSRNYASRLVAGRLVFYAPIEFDPNAGSLGEQLPAVRRWGGADTTFQTTIDPTRVYRPGGPTRIDGFTLHTVTVCDPAAADLRCRSTAFFGPSSRSFYVSPAAVYVWATRDLGEKRREPTPLSVLYRMPLDGGPPSGLRVSGAPLDQLSFLESGDGFLNVLVRQDGAGDGMWGPELEMGDLALLRLPLARLGDATAIASPELYRPLPGPGSGSLQNRFIGDWLVYGAGGAWYRSRVDSTTAYATRWNSAGPVDSLALPHRIDRIEQMGTGALLVGGSGADLHFSGVRLGSRAEVAGSHVRPDAAQGETRTHGFFYRQDSPDGGLIGLPVRGGRRPGYEQLVHGSAAMLFLRNEDFRFVEAGALEAREARPTDGCRASCVDWYGNARPIFMRGRILALLGYELVEGVDRDGRVAELRRVDFSPRSSGR